MVATIEGLPNRVSVEPVSISQDDSVARFKLILHEDASTGTFDKMVCRLTGELGGSLASIRSRLTHKSTHIYAIAYLTRYIGRHAFGLAGFASEY